KVRVRVCGHDRGGQGLRLDAHVPAPVATARRRHARKLPHRRVMRSWPVLVRVVRFQSLRSYARARSQSYAGCVNLPARHPRLVAASKTRMAGTSPATTNEDSAEVMTVLGQSRNPRLGVLRQDLLAAFLGDRDVEYPVERVEGGVRPVRGIQE